MVSAKDLIETPDDLPIFGTFSEDFRPVAEAFVRNFVELGDFGASVCVYYQGNPVVDLTGGWSSKNRQEPYDQDRLQMVFSSTKGAVTVCALQLIENGLLDPDARVVEYWPTFAKGNPKKAQTTVRDVFSHRAGLPVIDATLTLEEILSWDPVILALEHQDPIWDPGSRHGYHALTFGWLAGELVARITGTSIGEYFSKHVAGPLGLEFWIGLPADYEDRVSPLRIAPLSQMGSIDHLDPALIELASKFLTPDSLMVRALTLNGSFGQFMGGKGPFNSPEVHQAQIPAANGITNARSLAKMYGAVAARVDGVSLVGPATLKDGLVELSCGPDAVLPSQSRFGFGFMLADDEFVPMVGANSFGHSGAGGSLGFGDATHEIGFGYVMNQMRLNITADERQRNLIDALRSSLEVN